MPSITLRIPMIARSDGSTPPQILRRFEGTLLDGESVARVARIVREGLVAMGHPDATQLVTNSDDWLVQQTELVAAIPNKIWDANGLYPVSEWEPAKNR